MTAYLLMLGASGGAILLLGYVLDPLLDWLDAHWLGYARLCDPPTPSRIRPLWLDDLPAAQPPTSAVIGNSADPPGERENACGPSAGDHRPTSSERRRLQALTTTVIKRHGHVLVLPPRRTP